MEGLKGTTFSVMTVRRRALRTSFVVFECCVFGSTYFLMGIDWRNPALKPYRDTWGLLFAIGVLGVALISFLLRKTDKDCTRAGLITVIAILILSSVLFPTL